MSARHDTHRDAYDLVLDAIDQGIYRPGDRLVESELAERFGVSRTPVREALQRLETQSLLTRDGRSLIVPRSTTRRWPSFTPCGRSWRGWPPSLPRSMPRPRRFEVLRDMVEADRALLEDPEALARANRRFHNQIHLASHNRFLVQQLDLVYRSMALMARTSLAAAGRGVKALEEHAAIVDAIANRDGERAAQALKDHLSIAFVVRLKEEAEKS
jgi:DNA-binding GntR family transcriptional regulator